MTLDLLERYAVTRAGGLRAWSIQGRYGAALLVTSAALLVPFVWRVVDGQRDGGTWALGALALVVFAVGFGVSRLRESLHVDGERLLLSRKSLGSDWSWTAPRRSIGSLRIDRTIESDDSGTRTVFPVSLVLDIEGNEHAIAVIRPTKFARARDAALEISAALGLPLVDAVRDEDEHAPSVPHAVVAKRMRWAGIGFLGLATLAGYLASGFVEPSAMGWVIPFPFWGAGVYFLFEGERARRRGEGGSLGSSNSL